MKVVPIAELSGLALDWAVAKALELDLVLRDGKLRYPPAQFSDEEIYSPSTNREQGGEIIEDQGITVVRCDDDLGRDAQGYSTLERIPVWAATTGQHSVETSTDHQSHEAMYQVYVDSCTHGPTPLVAAMRALVASKFRQSAYKPAATIEVPEEVL